MTKEHEIRRAWEGFIENGALSKAVREIVVSSWQRCQSHGIPFERTEAPLASEVELVQCRSAHAALVEAAQGALKQARLFLAETDSMLMLTDPSGLVLETAGDPHSIDFGRQIHLEQGGRWNEANIGTNAIGTALATLEPVQIHGGEHFCREVQVWTCAATPIWHPHDHEVLGVIDISGLARTFTPQSLAFAVAVGRQIESALAQAIKYDHERLMRYFVTKRSLWLNEDVVAVEHRGTIVYGAESALQNLERRHRGLISEGRISFLKDLPATAWPVRLSELVPNSSTELVVDHNRLIGAILVLQKRRQPSTCARPRLLTERLLDFGEILGESAVMQEIRAIARKMSMTGAPILIEGETGVGKELFARAIHSAGPTAHGPFVPVNCGGMPRDLVGSELFGYSKGAFTGAREQGHSGKIEVSPPIAASSSEQSLSIHPNLKQSERAAIEAALAETGRNLTEAAKRLGIARSTLYRKLEEHGMARPTENCAAGMFERTRNFAIRLVLKHGFLTCPIIGHLCFHPISALHPRLRPVGGESNLWSEGLTAWHTLCSTRSGMTAVH